MKLLKWAIGGASAYVVYRYSIGRKAKGEDVFVTPEKAVAKASGESAPAKKRPVKTASTKKASVAKAPASKEQTVRGESTGAKPKSKRAPRKTAGKSASEG